MEGNLPDLIERLREEADEAEDQPHGHVDLEVKLKPKHARFLADVAERATRHPAEIIMVALKRFEKTGDADRFVRAENARVPPRSQEQLWKDKRRIILWLDVYEKLKEQAEQTPFKHVQDAANSQLHALFLDDPDDATDTDTDAGTEPGPMHQ